MMLSNLVVVAGLDAERSRLRGQLDRVIEGKLDVSISAHSLDAALIPVISPVVATWLQRRIRDIEDKLEELYVQVDD
jgi:hypothetical protein